VTARRRLALRAGLAFLAIAGAVTGVWALLFPRAFYDDFPLAGQHWVAMLPPYNQHLTTDTGGLNLAVAFSFMVAALTLQRLLVRTVLAGYLLYTVPHLIFHSRHLAGLPPSGAAAEMIVLSVTVGLPLALLALIRKPQIVSRA
jgi:hypothetical protein